MAVTTDLRRVGCEVRFVELPGSPEKRDFTDWRVADSTFDRFDELTEGDGVGTPPNCGRRGDVRTKDHSTRRRVRKRPGTWPRSKRSGTQNPLQDPPAGFVPAPGAEYNGAYASPYWPTRRL